MSDNIINTNPPSEPLTREEEYLSAIAGVTPSDDIPEKPLTRVEKYLNKIVEDGGGSVYDKLEAGTNINIEETSDGKAKISATGEVSSEDTYAREQIADHIADKDNPHEVSAADVGLGNCDNTSDLNKPISTATQTALNLKADKTEIPSVPITAIQKNGTGITPVSGTVNITVPTSAADVSALPDTTKYAAALSLTINSSTYVMTGQLKDQNDDNLGTAQTIDLPLESVVVGGSYNSQTKKVVLTLQNGNTIEFSVADLVSGLQTELSASNKLNPAYINYDSTHRAVSDTEKSTWNSKQNAIDSSHKLSADLVDDTSTTNKFATAAELEQIETNKNNISSIHKSGDLYFSETEPSGVIPLDSYWISTTGVHVYGDDVYGATLEQGSFETFSGAEITANNRVRTTFDSQAPTGTYTVSAEGADDVVIYAYTNNSTSSWSSADSVTAWQPLPYTFTTSQNLYLRFAFRHTDNTAIAPSDVSDVEVIAHTWTT